MKNFSAYPDERLEIKGKCLYCGKTCMVTKEHVPSKIFLDKPYPKDITTVYACEECNKSFALHEEYMAAIIECAICGSTDAKKLKREKIIKTLGHSEKLRKSLRNSKRKTEEGIFWHPELKRISIVVEKIARGHLYHELNLTDETLPHIETFLLDELNETERKQFEIPQRHLWPEVASRLLRRCVEGDENMEGDWIVVQKKRYRYTVTQEFYDEVRMVFSEYLGCRVAWIN